MNKGCAGHILMETDSSEKGDVMATSDLFMYAGCVDPFLFL
jgi:hypothetical protein